MPHRAALLRCLFVASLCGAPNVACTAQQATVNKEVPSDVPMADIHSLCVVPFSGPQGLDVAHALSEAIQSTQAFFLADATDDAPIPNQTAQADAALATARALHADAVIVGHMAPPDQEITCTAETKRNEPAWACVVTCERTITLQGDVMILNTERGRSVLYEPIDQILTLVTTHPVTQGSEHVAACEAPNLWGPDLCAQDAPVDGMRVALDHFAHHMAHRLVPHVISEQVMLYADAHLPGSQQALQALANNDWHTAVALYQDAIAHPAFAQATPMLQARALYNLGTVLAFGDAIAEGLTHLHRAQKLAPCPKFAEQILRVRRFAQTPHTIASDRHALRCHSDSQNHGAVQCTVLRT